MSAKQVNQQAASSIAKYGKLVSAARAKRLKALGHDFVEAERQGLHLHDTAGNKYLDCYCAAGIHNLGRRPEAVIAALRRSMHETDQGNFPMISREKAGLAEKLAAFVPGRLECSVYSVMRGEAFDFGCKLARGFTGRAEILAPTGSYFGHTGFALTLSEIPDKDDFAPLVPAMRMVDFRDPEDVRQAITNDTAAVIFEPLQVENHCRAWPAPIIEALWQRCGETGTLLGVDETQTGFGRTGRRFAFEALGLDPDFVILGEALGAGVFPIAATILTQRLNRFMNEHPLIHLSTFGGSDLGCAVGQAALDQYEHLRPWENAAALDARLRDGLEKLCAKHRRVLRDVAGMGLVWSLALTSPTRATSLCRQLAAHGVFAKPGEVATHTVVLRPPLTITEHDLRGLLGAVGEALAEVK